MIARFLCTAALTSLALAALHAEDPTDKLARRAVDRFLDAHKASDVDGMMLHVEVPWFHDAKEVITDRMQLRREFEKELAREKDRTNLQHKITQIVPYRTVRDKLREDERKLTDEVVRESDRLVLVLIGREADKDRGDKVAFLVGIKDGQAKVVGLKD